MCEYHLKTHLAVLESVGGIFYLTKMRQSVQKQKYCWGGLYRSQYWDHFYQSVQIMDFT